MSHERSTAEAPPQYATQPVAHRRTELRRIGVPVLRLIPHPMHTPPPVAVLLLATVLVGAGCTDTRPVEPRFTPARLTAPGAFDREDTHGEPRGIGVFPTEVRDMLYVADPRGGLWTVDGETGAVSGPVHDAGQPSGVYVGSDFYIVVDRMRGVVRRMRRASDTRMGDWAGLDTPGDAVESLDSSILVAETATGRLVEIRGTEAVRRRVVAEGFEGPVGLAWLEPTQWILVTERDAGRLVRVRLGDGLTEVVATGLSAPEAVAVLPDGGVLVVEAGARRLTWLDPTDGRRASVAEDLPMSTVAEGASRGLVASPTAVYFVSDTERAVYRLTPRR